MKRISPALLVLLALLGSNSPLSHAQSPASEETSVPMIRMQVNRVLVPVLVLDRAGAPVPGLPKDRVG
jgi:hypothetical protein